MILKTLKKERIKSITLPAGCNTFWCLSAYLYLPNDNTGEGNGTPLRYSCLENPTDGGAWQAAVHGVVKSWTRLSDFSFTFHFHALQKEMATHSSVLAWRIPGMGEPGGLPSMGSHRVGQDWSDLAAAATITHGFTCIRMVRVTFFFSCFPFFSSHHMDKLGLYFLDKLKIFSVFSYRKQLDSREIDNLMARKAGHPWQPRVARALAISVSSCNWGWARKQVRTEKPVEQLKHV